MTKSSDEKQITDHQSGGGHLGGTHFGQTGTDAKDETANKTGKQGDKARPNDAEK